MSAISILQQLSDKLSSSQLQLNDLVQLYSKILATLSTYGVHQTIQNDSSIDFISPLVNYSPTINPALIPILAKIVWNYIYHPYLNINVLMKAKTVLSQFKSVDSQLCHTDYYFMMNSDTTDDMNKYTTFLSSINKLLTQYSKIASSWMNDTPSINKLLELFSEYHHTWIKQLLHNCNPEFVRYIQSIDNAVGANYLNKCLAPSKTVTLEDSIIFVLQVLDHGMTCNLNSKVSHKLQICIDTINKSDKFELITTFNSLDPKISLSMCLNYLNFIISNKIMGLFTDTLPSCVTQHFKIFKLPPLTKPEVFLESEFKDPLGKLINIVDENDNYQNLAIIQHQILLILRKIMEDECKSIECINQVSNCSINDKMILSFLEYFIISLLCPLIVSTKFDKTVSFHQSHIIHECINKILTLKYKSIPSNKIWIALINILNDICYADLRYIEPFIELIQFQLNKDEKIGDDKLINSGLQFFIETFRPDHQWFNEIKPNVNEYEISLDDYKFLYNDFPHLTNTHDKS
ncbi:hypothetical protein SBY92_004723 [Candida maltosa Xu316]|uniref:Uncharacterized protein n=1 Tax=Candida maltosa (strain Xu316) TaxID=1245528 RepID=M3J6C5_CANMX|nr:hypothetical protein G210_2013 [Candida maltosa Xu316]